MKRKLTELLSQYANNSDGATQALYQETFTRMQRIASRLMERERRNHTWDVSDLVQEVWVKHLGSLKNRDFNNSNHFFNASKIMMERSLKDYARRRKSIKRGGRVNHVKGLDLDTLPAKSEINANDVGRFIRDIAQLNREYPQVGTAFVLRVFCDCSIEDIASNLQVTEKEIQFDLEYARAWFFTQVLN